MNGPLRAAVESALETALSERPLRLPEVEALLRVEDPGMAGRLFAAARDLRSRHFGAGVFLYGFVYFSTFCRNRCTFCLYRAGNGAGPRYRKTPEEVVAAAVALAEGGVHLIDLTMGEDPAFQAGGSAAPLVDLVAAVKQATPLPVMVSPGVVSSRVLGDLRAAGADWYACYQETQTPALFRRLRVGQGFRARAAARAAARALGLDVEDGMLVGVGETVRDRARSLLDMRAQGVRQARVMGFVPQEGTPLAARPPAGRLEELVTLATMRLVLPGRLIPASLDIEGIAGLSARLEAGANVVTSLIPAEAGLAGVSQATRDIAGGGRTVAGVQQVLAGCGLTAAGAQEYRAWLRDTTQAAEPRRAPPAPFRQAAWRPSPPPAGGGPCASA